jgi:hypothetical protein
LFGRIEGQTLSLAVHFARTLEAMWLGPKDLEKGVIAFVICVITGAVYLSNGTRSLTPSYEGYLVSASRFSQCTDTKLHCGYFVNERFLIHGNNSDVDSAHCTVTRTYKYKLKSSADKAVRDVKLGTTRTVWLKPTNHKVCYDAVEMTSNFVTGVVLLIVGGIPLLVVSCYYVVTKVRELLFGSPELLSDPDKAADDFAPGDADIEMTDGVANYGEASHTVDNNYAQAEGDNDGNTSMGHATDVGTYNIGSAAVSGEAYTPSYATDDAVYGSGYNAHASNYDSDAAYANKATL